ncbi:hypothetical protein Ancab_006343 [Ancistrocladus abbreviatus]
MATLQKFKLLATQCAVAGSPTRSPTTSPVIHLRRRRTLRMFLSRSSNSSGRRFHRRDEEDISDRRRRMADKSTESSKEPLSVRHKLKDLFVSSPPPLGDNAKTQKIGVEEEELQGLLPATQRAGSVQEWSGGLAITQRSGGSAGSLRPLSATLRQRLLRRAWRPVLVAIPEQSPASG